MNRKDVYAGMNPGTIDVGLGTRIQNIGVVPRHPRKKRKKKVRVVIRGTKSLQTVQDAVKTLERCRDALEGISSGTKRIRPLPDALPDGTDIETLDQMAAVSGLHRKAVPYAILESKDVSRELRNAALMELKAIVRTPEGEDRFHVPIGSVIDGVHVPVGTLKDGEKAYGDTRAPNGAPIRGRGISWQDERIPTTVYHVSTDAPAVRKSGRLIAGGVGGLGGDRRDRIVSMTISKPIADDLKENMRLVAQLAREHRETEPGTDANADESRKLVGKLSDQARSEGWDWDQGRWMADKDHVARNYGFKDWLNHYYMSRDSATNKPNPLFYSSLEDLRKIDPAKVDVIPIPKSALNNGAQLTDFDLGNGSLEEIRSYGDVPLTPDER